MDLLGRETRVEVAFTDAEISANDQQSCPVARDLNQRTVVLCPIIIRSPPEWYSLICVQDAPGVSIFFFQELEEKCVIWRSSAEEFFLLASHASPSGKMYGELRRWVRIFGLVGENFASI